MQRMVTTHHASSRAAAQHDCASTPLQHPAESAKHSALSVVNQDSATQDVRTTVLCNTLQAAILNYFLEKEGLANAEQLVHRGPEAIRTLPVYEGVLGLVAQVLGPNF